MKRRIKNIVIFILGMLIGGGIAADRFFRKIKSVQKLSEKHLSMFLTMNQWVKIRQEGKTISSYFERNGYKRIAIYGMSYMGETLLEELRQTEIEVCYAIDRNKRRNVNDVPVYSMKDMLDQTDAIIVTAITCFDEIRDALEKKVTCPIISLEDIIYES